jgi:IS4 transposase
VSAAPSASAQFDQFALPAASICALYKSRWQVELFFKWIKQHLRIHRAPATA